MQLRKDSMASYMVVSDTPSSVVSTLGGGAAMLGAAFLGATSSELEDKAVMLMRSSIKAEAPECFEGSGQST